MSLDFSLVDGEEEVFYSTNITHNLNTMAEHAGIYKALWRPEEIGVTKAAQLIPLLKEGVKDLCARPSYFKQFDASNRWGTWRDFLPFVVEVLEACEQHPDADIRVWR